jgi:parvulin-like peptidyl-prolyl isomerase
LSIDSQLWFDAGQVKPTPVTDRVVGRFTAQKHINLLSISAMNAVLTDKKARTRSPDLLALLRQYQLIPQLLQCMVIDRAIDPIFVTAAERESALAQFYEYHQLDSPAAIETWLRHNHLVTDEIEPVALRSLRIEKFKLKTWGNQLESYFLKRKSSLDRVIYSLIRTQDWGLAQEIYYRLQDDRQSFAELAHQFSEGAENQTGGRIGPVPLSQPHPAIGHLLTVSQAGQLWPPRQIDEWFAIVRLEHLEPIRFDAAVKQYLLQELFETWVRSEVARQSPVMLQTLESDRT